MATHIFDSKHSVLLEPQTPSEPRSNLLEKEYSGGAFRGFFYAMIFNVALFLIGAGVWELWRVIR